MNPISGLKDEEYEEIINLLKAKDVIMLIDGKYTISERTTMFLIKSVISDKTSEIMKQLVENAVKLGNAPTVALSSLVVFMALDIGFNDIKDETKVIDLVKCVAVLDDILSKDMSSTLDGLMKIGYKL